jgi:hypothetical protein
MHSLPMELRTDPRPIHLLRMGRLGVLHLIRKLSLVLPTHLLGIILRTGLPERLLRKEGSVKRLRQLQPVWVVWTTISRPCRGAIVPYRHPPRWRRLHGRQIRLHHPTRSKVRQLLVVWAVWMTISKLWQEEAPNRRPVRLLHGHRQTQHPKLPRR